jgi:hypothetical protein
MQINNLEEKSFHTNYTTDYSNTENSYIRNEYKNIYRKFSRYDRKIYIYKLSNEINLHFSQNNIKSLYFLEFIKIVLTYFPNCNLLLDQQINKNIFSLINFLPYNIKNKKQIQINILEYFLANYATKYYGVKIYHEKLKKYCGFNSKNILKHVNQNTLGIFDASGGNFLNLKKGISTDSYWNGIGIRGEKRIAPFTKIQIDSGNLCPNNAIFKININNNDLLYCAIGDTYLRSNYTKGNGLYFGFGISFLITIIISMSLLQNQLQQNQSNI